jgi:hypothetical protein
VHILTVCLFKIAKRNVGLRSAKRLPDYLADFIYIRPQSRLDIGVEEKPSASVGDRTPVAQSVASDYTDYATRLLHKGHKAIFPGKMRPGRIAKHSPPSSAVD